MFLNKNSIGGKMLSIMLVAAMVSSVAVTSAITSGATVSDTQASNASTNQVTSSANQYGLKSNPQDGVILHAWDWSLNNIKSKLPEIAAAGYSTVQTSVLQHCKEATVGKTNRDWWLFYQPASFSLDTSSGYSALGTRSDLQALCAEADNYGIKIIVDVVANHLGNQTKYDKSSAIISDIRDDNDCWHSEGFVEINYNDRYSITHSSMGGLPDLNTESSKIQGYVLDYLKDCIDCGVDGFRFDAAKHIGVPSEGSQFWPNTITPASQYYNSKTGDTLYCYGEILYDTGGPAISEYTAFMSITDSDTGNDIRSKVAGHNASGAANPAYYKGAAPNKSVLWAESHDTYSNDSKESTYVSDSDINKTWAIVGSRNLSTALYYARPSGWGQGNIGDICTYHWKDTEVVAVNKLHNTFAGQSEYLSSSGSIVYNERGTSGAVLVNVNGGSQQVSVTANKMAAGTYKDQVSDNTFTVANGKISGQIGDTGIAVIMNVGETPTDPPTNPTTPTSTNPSITYVRGDANGDSVVNLKDCIVTQKVTVGSTTLSGKNKLAADVDGNNKIAVADVVATMRYLVGYTNTYNIGAVVTGGVDDPTSPTSPTTPISDNVVHFNPGSVAVGNERWAVYVWKSETDNKWVDMSGSGSSYQVTLPSGYTNYIIARMNGATTDNNWNNCWNQSDNLTYSSSTNYVTATGWGSGNKFTTSLSSK